mmetsp:Transcript_31239/g.46670  ORF Transcript_31239/g.46670 Transcript_31239/m.46670 type:complete len:287 (+) Transcript_31239:194-1054(+)
MIPSPVFVKYDSALFDAIHRDVPTFLPPEDHKAAITWILSIAGAITLFHLVLLQMVKVWQGSKETTHAAWKASYQLTNLLVNLILGCVGIYYQLFKIKSDEAILDRIVGNEHMMLFSAGQVGYQLWALPIGIIFVGETKSMIIHHVAVICVGSVTAFISSGFRYFTPYFYGAIEISSVPLSVMNSFKNNPDWIKKYPGAYKNVRLVFGITFLLVRVVLWTPIYWNFVSLASMLLYSSDVVSTQIILSIFILASLVLTILQYFWASKIVGALVKGGPKKKKEAKKVD